MPCAHARIKIFKCLTAKLKRTTGRYCTRDKLIANSSEHLESFNGTGCTAASVSSSMVSCEAKAFVYINFKIRSTFKWFLFLLNAFTYFSLYLNFIAFFSPSLPLSFATIIDINSKSIIQLWKSAFESLNAQSAIDNIDCRLQFATRCVIESINFHTRTHNFVSFWMSLLLKLLGFMANGISILPRMEINLS